MIINLQFGYTARHHIYYDTQLKRGTIKLWSSHRDSRTGAESVETGGSFFEGNQHTEFMIADENDILPMVASLDAVMNGTEFSFTSKEGRKITLALDKKGTRKKDAITVDVQYSKVGKLTMGEAHKLQSIAKDILRDLGYSDQKISEKLESITN